MAQTLTCGSTGIRPLKTVWKVRSATGSITRSGRWATQRNRKEIHFCLHSLFFHSVLHHLLCPSFTAHLLSPLSIPQTSEVSVGRQKYCINLISSSSQYELQVRSRIGNDCGKSLFWSDWSQPVVWGSNNGTGKYNLHSLYRMKWRPFIVVLWCYRNDQLESLTVTQTGPDVSLIFSHQNGNERILDFLMNS